jgi:RHS repeat-associated protein
VLQAKHGWGLLASFVMTCQFIAWGCIPAPLPGETITPLSSCCYPGITATPCDTDINRCFLTNIVTPTVTVVPNGTNPNLVSITVVNGSYDYNYVAGCNTGTYCGGTNYIWNTYIRKSSKVVIPSVVYNYPSSAWVNGSQTQVDTALLPTNQCTVDVSWGITGYGCSIPFHKESFPIGPCALAPQTKPNPVAKINNCNAAQVPSAAPCQPGEPDPVDPYSGDYYYAESDMTVPGVVPLVVVRAYSSSRAGVIGPFGRGAHLAGYNYKLTVPVLASGAVNTAANQSVTLNEGNGLLSSFSNGAAGGLIFTNASQLGTAGSTLTLTTNATGVMTGAEYKTPDNTRFGFNAQGWLVSSTDNKGNTVALTRNATNQLVTASILGRSITFAYNAAGRIITATDHTGRTVKYTYDGSDRLTTVKDINGKDMGYGWDASNRIQTRYNQQGNTEFLNVYQANGMIKQQTLAVGENEFYGEDANYKLDATGPLERRITDPNNNTRSLTYNSRGLVVAEKDGLNNTTTTTYSSSLFNGGATNRFIEQTDPLLQKTRQTLNTLNSPTQLRDADNKNINITYDTVWPTKPKTITNALGNVTTFTYDAAGNVASVKDPLNNTTTMTYNSRGQVLTVTNALGKTTTYAYNASGDLTSITNPLSQTTAMVYDALGRLTTLTDAKNQNTIFTYNAESQVNKITDALGNITEYFYSPTGKLTGQKNALNNQTNYTWDRKNRLVRIVQPLGSAYQWFTYDKADRLTEYKDQKDQVRQYTYDAANRLTNQQVKVSNVTQQNYTYAYDVDDRLLTITDGTGTWTMTYDVVDRVTSVASPQGTVSYTYDANSRRTSMTPAGQSVVTYAYDVLDRLTGVTQSAQTHGYSYDAIGRQTGQTRPNGVTTTNTFNDANQLTSMRHLKTGVVDEQHTYTYDAVGNVAASNRTPGPVGKIYTYDAVNRVTSVAATGALPGGSTPQSASWTYDANGNMATYTPAGGVTQTYAYNNRDFLTSVTPTGGTAVTYTYDANGNLTSDSTGRSLVWNGLDQLTQLTPTSGATPVVFGYDVLGRRIQAGTKTGMLYDGINLLSHNTAQFLQGNGLDTPLKVTAGGVVSHYLTDSLGSVTQLTNVTGAPIARYDYQTYGKQEAGGTPLAANPFTYTAREDDGTGLLYYRNRYYDPSLQAFISQDPLGDAQRYVGGNPLSFTDPLGLYGDEGPSQAEIDAIDPVGAIFRKPILFFWPSFGVSGAISGLLAPSSVTIPSTSSRCQTPSTLDRNTLARIRGLEEQLKLHKQKLAQFQRDPFSMDNKGYLRNNITNPERLNDIIKSRNQNLINQINNFQRQIDSLKKGGG